MYTNMDDVSDNDASVEVEGFDDRIIPLKRCKDQSDFEWRDN